MIKLFVKETIGFKRPMVFHQLLKWPLARSPKPMAKAGAKVKAKMSIWQKAKAKGQWQKANAN